MRVVIRRYILIVSELNTFQKKLKIYIGNKNIKTNIYIIQAYDSIMCEYFCFVFIDFMLNDGRLVDLLIHFIQTIFLKNDKISLNIFNNLIMLYNGKLDNLYPRINESLNGPGVNNSEFKIKRDA